MLGKESTVDENQWSFIWKVVFVLKKGFKFLN